jgi:hypothetical protein
MRPVGSNVPLFLGHDSPTRFQPPALIPVQNNFVCLTVDHLVHSLPTGISTAKLCLPRRPAVRKYPLLAMTIFEVAVVVVRLVIRKGRWIAAALSMDVAHHEERTIHFSSRAGLHDRLATETVNS